MKVRWRSAYKGRFLIGEGYVLDYVYANQNKIHAVILRPDGRFTHRPVQDLRFIEMGEVDERSLQQENNQGEFRFERD